MIINNLKDGSQIEENSCKNCKQKFVGAFCNYCGQKHIQDKLNLNEIFTGISDSFNLQKGFFKTVRELLLYPDLIISNFLSGKRKTYYNPIKFFLIALTVEVFVETLFSTANQSVVALMNSPIWIVFNLLLLIPITAFFTKMLNKNYNYLENIVINIYACGILVLMNLIFTLLFRAFSYLGLEVTYLEEITHYSIRIGFLTWFYFKVFQMKIWKSFLFSFFVYFLSFIALYVAVKLWLPNL